VDIKTDKSSNKLTGSPVISSDQRWVDPGQEFRYSAETQDEAYRTGAYDVIETLDFSPRIAVQAGYVSCRQASSVLDIGCGTGELLKYLNSNIRYVGLDISPTAIETARLRYSDRPKTDFFAANFREWRSPEAEYDCIVWAGIGRTWTRGGRKGDKRDWLEILLSFNPYLAVDGIIVIEATKDHWPELSRLIEQDYRILAGCDVDCLVNDHRSVRSARVIQPITSISGG
jgi:SAM-dependent methyltransferase